MPALPVPNFGSAADSATSSSRTHSRSHGSRTANGRPDSRQRMSPVRAVLPPLPSRSPAIRRTSPRLHAAATPSASSSRSLFSSPNSPFAPTAARSYPQLTWSDLTDHLTDYGGADPDLEAVSLVDTSQTDDQCLSLIADTDWSSPSAYPSFTTNASSGAGSSQGTRASGSQRRQPNSQPTNNLGTSSRSSQHANTVSQPTTSLLASAPISIDDDLFDDFDDNILSVIAGSPSATIIMPAITRSRASELQETTAPSKRQRTTAAFSPRGPTTLAVLDSDDDPFLSDSGEENTKGRRGSKPMESGTADGLEAIDLTKTNGMPEEATKREVDNRVKLGAFQCAICMDDVTSLVVTHCGHLYCAACLHQSLHVASTRGKCPMCRAKVETKPRSTYTGKTKGYWPLELKLMTAVKKGKRKADDMIKE